MTSYETSITIAASQETVWQILSDVARWSEWLPTVTRVEPQESQILALGTRFALSQPKLRPAIWIVTRLEPPHGFTWESRGPGYQIIADHWIEQSANNQSTVLLRVTFSGLLAALLKLASGALTESYIAQEAAALKQTVESHLNHGA